MKTLTDYLSDAFGWTICFLFGKHDYIEEFYSDDDGIQAYEKKCYHCGHIAEYKSYN